MTKRVLAALLWFYVTWMVWTAVAFVSGLGESLGPVVALLVTAFVAVDPMHKIWGSNARLAGAR